LLNGRFAIIPSSRVRPRDPPIVIRERVLRPGTAAGGCRASGGYSGAEARLPHGNRHVIVAVKTLQQARGRRRAELNLYDAGL
jgi:hypothetical protein